MSLSDVTLIVHSYNRPELLFRLLRYYSHCPEMAEVEVIVADGSWEAQREEFLRMMAAAGVTLRYRLISFPPELPLHHRLQAVLPEVTRPFTLLAADDDFYMFDWLVEASAYLSGHPDTNVVHGQYLTFSLNGFRAFSNEIVFRAPFVENPPIPWQEQSSPIERLEEIARLDGGLMPAGWYALQRTHLLVRLLNLVIPCALPVLLFERFLVVAQAASGKAHMIDRLFIVRQSDLDPARDPPPEPLGLHDNREGVAQLKDCCVRWLSEECGIVDAGALVDRVLAADLRWMRDADRKRLARALANHFPILNRLRRKNPISGDPDRLAMRDPRFPQPRPPMDYRRYTDIISHEVRA